MVGILAVGEGPVPEALTGFWKPIPHTGLLYQTLIWGEELSPTSPWYAMLCWRSWEACSFQNRNRRVDAWGGDGNEKRRGGRNWGRDKKDLKTSINKKKKKKPTFPFWGLRNFFFLNPSYGVVKTNEIQTWKAQFRGNNFIYLCIIKQRKFRILRENCGKHVLWSISLQGKVYQV